MEQLEKVDEISLLGHVSLLLMRLYVGLSMVSAGLSKIPLPHWMTEQVEAISWMPMPEFMAGLASYTEFAGGILITLGLLTRPAAFFLAITMAVAAFSSQDTTPFIGIHVAQGYLWSYVVLLAIGAGRMSLDHLLKSWGKWIGIGVAGILAIYTISQGTLEPESADSEGVTIESLALPGTFNDWDPASDKMSLVGDSIYRLEVDLAPGPIEFKVAVNEAWDINLGVIESNEPTFPLETRLDIDSQGNTQNVKAFIPKEGEYTITLDLKSLELRLDSL
ncbi:MAG: DoxX family membrane protein [Flavobacteriales bacterium]|nr:DoxX family membrane protein [Flavobacteriales bacterium]